MFWAQVYRHCAVICAKVQKVTTKIGETSSLINHIYIMRYIVIWTNWYIVMHAPRGPMVLRNAYCRATKCLSEHVYTTHIQQKVIYNTPIQQANRKIKQKIKTNFYWSDKSKHMYPDWFKIKFILTHKMNKAKGRGNRKTD